MLLEIRSNEGGWSYGVRLRGQIPVPLDPHLTGVVLTGLQGAGGLAPSIDLARQFAHQPVPPLAHAWLSIALRLHGVNPPAPTSRTLPVDQHIQALEAIAAPEGNFGLLKTEMA